MDQPAIKKDIILYADDDADDVEYLREGLLPFAQVELKAFPNGAELLPYVQNLSRQHDCPCMIILDINMPKMGGREALKALRKLKDLEATPVVLYTTCAMAEDKRLAKELRAGVYVKPISQVERNQVIDAMLSGCAEDVRQRIFGRG